MVMGSEAGRPIGDLPCTAYANIQLTYCVLFQETLVERLHSHCMIQ